MVESFCCFRLHTAAVVIGWIGAALSLFNIATYIIIIANVNEFVKDWIINNGTNNIDDDIDVSVNVSEESAKITVMIVLSIYLILNLINCLASCLLIAGAMKERHLMLVPWLLNSAISIGYSLINSLGVIVFLTVNGATFGSVIIAVIFAFIVLGFEFYAWSAMYSLFKLIRTSSEEQRLILPHKGGTTYPSYTKI